MNARLAGAIGTGVELLAAATFAGAVSFATCATLRTYLPQPQVNVLAIAGGALGFLLASLVARRAAARTASFRTPAFHLADFHPFEVDELVLSDEQRVEPQELVLGDADRLEPGNPEALELDDVLAAIGPDSRVVRLFDRNAMATPGQLQSRIEDHLGQRTSGAPQDASQALSDALAELRRSLR